MRFSLVEPVARWWDRRSLGARTAVFAVVAAFSILIIVLIFLPTGLLGRPEVEKV